MSRLRLAMQAHGVQVANPAVTTLQDSGCPSRYNEPSRKHGPLGMGTRWPGTGNVELFSRECNEALRAMFIPFSADIQPMWMQ